MLARSPCRPVVRSDVQPTPARNPPRRLLAFPDVLGPDSVRFCQQNPGWMRAAGVSRPGAFVADAGFSLA